MTTSTQLLLVLFVMTTTMAPSSWWFGHDEASSTRSRIPRQRTMASSPTVVSSFVLSPPSKSPSHYSGAYAVARRRRPPSFFSLMTSATTTTTIRTASSDDSPSFDGHHHNNRYNVSLLIIDHYDSFTYNLYDMLAQLTLEPPVVMAKDSPLLLCDVHTLQDQFDGIILSPGPGRPHDQESLPLLQELIHHGSSYDLPILGVCLGHQMLALAYGARVDRAPEPIHGQDHWIRRRQQQQQQQQQHLERPLSLFHNVPGSFRVVRYHSLCAYLDENDHDTVPLEVTARTLGNHEDCQSDNKKNNNPNKYKDDGSVIQAIQHVHRPHYGVQFHPESIGTQHGLDLLENFVRVVKECKVNKSVNNVTMDNLNPRNNGETKIEASRFVHGTQKPRFRVMIQKYDPSSSSSSSSGTCSTPSPLRVFERLYNDVGKEEEEEEENDTSSSSLLALQYAVWLDSSSYTTSQRGTIDILAAPTRTSDILEHFSAESSNTNDNVDIMSKLEEQLFGSTTAGDSANTSSSVYTHAIDWVGGVSKEEPPFHYRGGLLGYLGYEVRHETQRFLQQRQGALRAEVSHKRVASDVTTNGYTRSNSSNVPTAAFFLARQSMVFHHPSQTWYLIGLVEDDKSDIQENLDWMRATCEGLEALSTEDESTKEDECSMMPDGTPHGDKIPFTPNRPKEVYEQDIAECHKFIRMGDSYELCLTNQLEAHVRDAKLSTFDLYRTLRQRNPAPYSAYLRWNAKETKGKQEDSSKQSPSSSLVICSSSPEKFMSVTRQQPHPEITPFLQAEAKPIKGTCARVLPKNGVCRTDSELREDERRARSLELSLKNRAENLMIVDLLRNDLSRVCRIGSVHVSKLMDIESFATVHQMVSTIRGTLNDSATPIDLLRASFPGGSMTGAPKIRTMELLDELEQHEPRGPYSGSLGYLSVNGCMSLNIVIRSAVLTPYAEDTNGGGWKVSIGAGGAITALSEVEDEYAEMNLKAQAVVSAVQEWAAASTKSSQSRTGSTTPMRISDKRVL